MPWTAPWQFISGCSPLQSLTMKAVVIIISDLRLDFIGCYGNDWVETPALDRLAAEAIVFDRHYAECPEPDAAHRAWRGGVHHPASTDVDLVRLLKAQGVFTSLVTDDRLPPSADFSQDWNHTVSIPAERGKKRNAFFEKGFAKLLGTLKKQESWLTWVELAQLQTPWNIPQEYLDRYFDAESAEEDDDDDDEEVGAAAQAPLLDFPAGLIPATDDETFLRLQKSYAACVTYVDEQLGFLIDALHKAELDGDTLLIVTADRGLPLGEHGLVGHVRPWLHDELVHVPFIMRLPDGAQAGRRVNALSQHADLLPTLLDLFGLSSPAMAGHSLLPLAHGQGKTLREHVCSSLQMDESLEWALRTPEWGFILPVRPWPGDPPRGPQLYVKPDDRREVNDLRQHNLELAEELEQTLQTHYAEKSPGGKEQADSFKRPSALT